jgi:hypothetical protein
MATNQILHTPLTPVVFTSSGGDVVITLGSLANGAGRVSAQWDRGAGSKPALYTIQAKMKAAAALAVGASLEVYLLQSYSTDYVPGNVGIVDADLAGTDKRRNLGAPVITISADSTTNGENQFSNSYVVEVYGRYVSVAVWNALGQALHATGTNSLVVLTPYVPDIQAAA